MSTPAEITSASISSTHSSSSSSSSFSSVSSPTSSSSQTSSRLCSLCSESFPRNYYSSTQWQNPAKNRKCMQCASQINLQNLQKTSFSTKTIYNNHQQTNKSNQSIQTGKSNTAKTGTSKQKITNSSSSLPALLIDDENSPDDGWFVPAVESIFTEIFHNFDEDKDGGLNGAELQIWAHACNNKQFSDEELNEIKDNLEHDDKNNLSLQGFLNFYLLQSSSHPAETWKDLKKLGYDTSLKRKHKIEHENKK